MGEGHGPDGTQTQVPMTQQLFQCLEHVHKPQCYSKESSLTYLANATQRQVSALPTENLKIQRFYRRIFRLPFQKERNMDQKTYVKWKMTDAFRQEPESEDVNSDW